METATRFDLNVAVMAWRDELQRQPSIAANAILELEEHLLCSVEEIQKSGLTEEEAFLVALRRLGQPARLEPEFRKGDPATVWRQRVFWMAVGWFAMCLWGRIFGPFTVFIAEWTNRTHGQGWAAACLTGGYLILVGIPIGAAAILAHGRLLRSLQWCQTNRRYRWRLAIGLGVLFSVATLSVDVMGVFLMSQNPPHDPARIIHAALWMGPVDLVKGVFVTLVLGWLLPVAPKPGSRISCQPLAKS